MKFEKSCGAVIYGSDEDTLKFLVVRSRVHGHWGFPKGHVEEGESEQETAKREVLEETGLDISISSEFRTSIKYSPEEGICKEVVFFIGRSLNEKVSIQQEEIQDYKWLNYDETLKFLTFQDERKVLIEANDFINRTIRMVC